MRTMPEVIWAVNWAVLGLLFAAYALRRAWVQHRTALREFAAVRRYEELREGEYASIGGTAELKRGDTGPFDVVMEGGRVHVDPEHRARVEGAVTRRADEIIAVEADRPVFVAGTVERSPDGGFSIHAVPGQRMAVATVPLWRRAARRRLAHALIALVMAGGAIGLFRYLAWDALRLTLDGRKVHATLSNAREVDEERFSVWDFGFRKVERTELDATYVDEQGVTRRFTPVVDRDTEWLWSLRADQAEVHRLGIEPVEQWFVILPQDPAIHQLGERVRLHPAARLAPLAFLAVAAVLYWLILVRPELPPRRRNPRHRIVARPGSAA